MQLSGLVLDDNKLEGTLPGWSNLTKVSHRHLSEYLLLDVTSYFVHMHICS